MKKSKKGQAAMEFLMTYGWAILVVLAAIGALAYFGVLSPGRFVPSKCQVSPGFGCTDSKAQKDSVELTLRNNIGDDLEAGVAIGFSGDDIKNCQMTHPVPGDAGTNYDPNSYTWTVTDNGGLCTIATGSNCYATAAQPIKNGRDMAHFYFQCGAAGANTFSNNVAVDFNIVYTKSGETVQHSASGDATLKVEQ